MIMLFKNFARRGLLSVSLVLNMEFIAVAADCNDPTTFPLILPSQGNPPTAGEPFSIIAIGDSIVWGNGLKAEHKTVSLVAQQVANMTGRSVQLVSYAHSGARLSEPTGLPDEHLPPDLNAPTPNIGKQESCAAAKYANAELVLLDGCINEVGATNIALPLPGETADKVQNATIRFCGKPMDDLLKSVAADFPRATVAIYSYYRVVSGSSSPLKLDSKPDKALRRMHRKTDTAAEPRVSTAAMAVPMDQHKQQWHNNSAAFYVTSRKCLNWAVARAKAGLSGTSITEACQAPFDPPSVQPGERFLLATVPDEPKFAYGGSDTHLWKLVIRFLFWTFRKDEFYNQRNIICNQTFNDELDMLGCQINPIAHPNVKGAQAYSDSITALLKTAWNK